MVKYYLIRKDICCLCGEYRSLEYNAAPVKEGRCCDVCHEQLVIPTRIFAILAKRESA